MALNSSEITKAKKENMDKLQELDTTMYHYVEMLQHITDYMRTLGIGETFLIPDVMILPPDEDGWGLFEFKYQVRGNDALD